MPAIGGKYEIGERLGGGGMADVFRATIRGAEGFARPVAVKRIKRSISTDKGFATLFVSEATLAAKLHHPNVVQTLDFDRDENGCFYLVMELIDGVDLRALSSSGPLPVSVCCFVVSELLRALDYAHELVDDGQPITVIHRDISPHNIMIGWQGAVKVVDFGIAKAIDGSLVSRSGSLKGKVAYMSPEQVHGHELDGRSDLFAAGIVLHELLTGARLFVGDTEAETLAKVLTQPIPLPSSLNPEVPADLEAIVMRLLARDRAHRYTRARDAMEELLDSSVSSTQGRRDLELLMVERFPERAPRRKARLSKSPSPAASSSFDALVQSPAEQLVPKRTVTAGPEPLAENRDAPELRAPANQWRLRLARIGLALLVIAVALVVGLSGGDITDNRRARDSENAPLAAVGAPAAPVSEPAVEGIADEAAHDASSPRDAQSALLAPAVDVSAATSETATSETATSETATTAKRGEKAVLTIRVKPWAVVSVDGKEYGQTPQTIRLRRGKHRISLENEGLGKRESFSLTLKAGQKKTILKNWL